MAWARGLVQNILLEVALSYCDVTTIPGQTLDINMRVFDQLIVGISCSIGADVDALSRLKSNHRSIIIG